MVFTYLLCACVQNENFAEKNADLRQFICWQCKERKGKRKKMKNNMQVFVIFTCQNQVHSYMQKRKKEQSQESRFWCRTIYFIMVTIQVLFLTTHVFVYSYSMSSILYPFIHCIYSKRLARCALYRSFSSLSFSTLLDVPRLPCLHLHSF